MGSYTLASDTWSVGMVVFELATGRYPFSDVSSFPTLMASLCDLPEPRLDPTRFPPEPCDFVASCLCRDVIKRPYAAALAEHPFLVNSGPGACLAFAEWLTSVN